MNTLAAQQRALLDALFTRAGPEGTPDISQAAADAAPFSGDQGLRVYRNNAQAQARRCMDAAFPVLAQLLGEENLAMLARDFWLAHPPQTGDLAQWGSALPDFLVRHTQLADEPYLADVARVDWAMHTAGSAADKRADPGSFRLLTECTPDAIQIVLASGLHLIHSDYPVASIVGAHRDGVPALEDAARLLHDRVPESAIVCRQGLRPRMARCDSEEIGFLQALVEGRPLGAALAQAPGFAFDRWLPQAVKSGLVLGIAARPLGLPTHPAQGT